MALPETPPPDQDGTATVVARNIHTLLARRRAEERAKGREEHIADAVTRFAGTMRFVYIHVVLFGAWILLNLPWLPIPKFDPSLVLLAMFASVEAIFVSTFVLITQNRMAALADKRADLDLQISLLSEHEVTRLIGLVTKIADRMGIEASSDPELQELSRDVAPEQVLDQLEQTERQFTGKAPGGGPGT
jgi:uncharacterized membrane protein